MLTLSTMLMLGAISACSTLEPVRIAQIPLRDDLRRCEALAPMLPDALPPVPEDASVRAAVIRERAAWMRRDLAQADVVKDACNKLGELVALIDANNAGPEDE